MTPPPWERRPKNLEGLQAQWSWRWGRVAEQARLLAEEPEAGIRDVRRWLQTPPSPLPGNLQYVSMIPLSGNILRWLDRVWGVIHSMVGSTW